MSEDPLEEFAKQYDPQKFVVKYEGGGSVSSDGDYSYIAKLMLNPVPDGRHRIAFRILTRYLVNVQGLSDDEAFEALDAYFEACEAIEPTHARGRLMEWIQYARRTGYKPPFLETIQNDDPDLYLTIMKAITSK